MKKLILLFVAILAFSCSSDDDSNRNQECEVKVWGVNSNCNPAPNCVYSITLITNGDEENLETVTVNKATHDYYQNLLGGNGNQANVCYDGLR